MPSSIDKNILSKIQFFGCLLPFEEWLLALKSYNSKATESNLKNNSLKSKLFPLLPGLEEFFWKNILVNNCSPTNVWSFFFYVTLFLLKKLYGYCNNRHQGSYQKIFHCSVSLSPIFLIKQSLMDICRKGIFLILFQYDDCVKDEDF